MKTYVEEIRMRETVITFANARSEDKPAIHKALFETRRALAAKTGMPYAANRLNEIVKEIL